MTHPETKPQPYDALFIGAHPDDIEIICGGTVRSFTASGKRVMIADATQGEMGSRGTVEERMVEAAKAAEILQADRCNLHQPDGRLIFQQEALVRAVVQIIRQTKPRFVFTHAHGDHHPDHNALAETVKYAVFQANVLRYETDQERHQIGRLFTFGNFRKRLNQRPDIIVDITPFFDEKVQAIKAYGSQVSNPNYAGANTYLSSPEAWRSMELASAALGALIDKPHAEGFFAHAPLWLDDVFALQDAGI
ncbi:MAG: bacillithiol biosynthesis deacetylase BshB1 [Sumerlaeia bacterium]